ncbi:hypothetical protein MC885_013393 [Smutsia gigantea]|nr:hypothetical protein MC885_013393 [Smutsia gigantea]
MLAMHKWTAHNDTEPIKEEQEAFFEPPPGQSEDVLKGSQITYVTGVEGDDVVSTVTQFGLSQQVTLISQDGTQHVNISQADMQAIGNTITMVMQDGTPITVPAQTQSSPQHEHTRLLWLLQRVQKGSRLQLWPGLGSIPYSLIRNGAPAAQPSVTTETRPLTLVATSNGTQIAVQLGEQPSLEEAIRIAYRIQQGETPGVDD